MFLQYLDISTRKPSLILSNPTILLNSAIHMEKICEHKIFLFKPSRCQHMLTLEHGPRWKVHACMAPVRRRRDFSPPDLDLCGSVEVAASVRGGRPAATVLRPLPCTPLRFRRPDISPDVSQPTFLICSNVSQHI